MRVSVESNAEACSVRVKVGVVVRHLWTRSYVALESQRAQEPG